MKVAVTGGAGFIGSHIVDRLIELGHDVIILDDFSSGKKENLNAQAEVVEIDIRDKKLEKILVDLHPDVVCHHAAHISVRRSIEDPAYDIDVNICGTINLLKACGAANVKKFIFAGSAARYGDPESVPIKEHDQCLPINTYGVSKYMIEKYISMYSEQFGMQYVVLCYANVYGPRQDPAGEGGVVSIFMDRIKQGDACHIFGDGEQTRDFVHVSDIARVNSEMVEKDLSSLKSHIFNVGTGTAITINELFDMVATACGQKGVSPKHDDAIPGEIRDSCLDSSALDKEFSIQCRPISVELLTW